jgi:hypothetical protein
MKKTEKNWENKKQEVCRYDKTEKVVKIKNYENE